MNKLEFKNLQNSYRNDPQPSHLKERHTHDPDRNASLVKFPEPWTSIRRERFGRNMQWRSPIQEHE